MTPLAIAVAVALLACPRAAPGQAPVPVEPVVPEVPFDPPVDWDQRDLEGRWALYESRMTKRPAELSGWMKFLQAKKAYALLELIAIYRLNESQLISDLLARMDAPRWLPVMIWIMNYDQGHVYMRVMTTLRSKRPGYTLAWLEKHPEAVYGQAAATLTELKKTAPKREDVSDAPKPLDPAVVLRDLDAPAKLAVFGSRTRAEAGVRYVHQVKRAMDGLVISGRREAKWLEKLLALTTHGNAEIRQAAFLTYTRMRQFVPLDATERALNDDKERPKVREAALMAFSFAQHPRVYAKLHALALTPGHPIWRAAVSRLGDLGDGFTLLHLKNLNTKLKPDQLRLLDAQRDRIRERIAAYKPENMHRGFIQQRLERAAWTDLMCDPLEGTLIPWTLKSLGAHIGTPVVRQGLESLSTDYVPVGGLKKTAFGSMQARVRMYAKRILDVPAAK
jgi:hypothetical protein